MPGVFTISTLSLSFLYQIKKKSNIASTKGRSLGQEALEKMARLFSGSTLFIDEGIKLPSIRISTHLLIVSSNLILFNMSNQPDMIHHMISVIMTQFANCYHPLQLPKRLRTRKRILTASLQSRLNFPSQKRDQSTPLLSSRTRGKRKWRGICSSQIWTYTKIATRVTPCQNLSRKTT